MTTDQLLTAMTNYIFHTNDTDEIYFQTLLADDPEHTIYLSIRDMRDMHPEDHPSTANGDLSLHDLYMALTDEERDRIDAALLTTLTTLLRDRDRSIIPA